MYKEYITSQIDKNIIRTENVPVVFRMKIKISKSRISLLTSGIICHNLLKNKIYKIKIWFLASENT
jgi:hypothetical protein